MKEAKVIFTFNGNDLTIQCTIDDKMKDIYEKYSKKINKEMNSLLFLYLGNQVNFNLKFKEQANHLDLKENKMNILVCENELVICLKCKHLIQLNKKIIDTISGIKFQIDNIIKISESNIKNTQLTNIIIILDKINEDIKNNNEKIKKIIYSVIIINIVILIRIKKILKKVIYLKILNQMIFIKNYFLMSMKK